MFRQLKRVFISLIVAIIAFYPLFTPVAFAVDSWSGNPWTGDTWEGDPWEGSNLQWEGNGTEGNAWDGEGTQGEGWTGDPMQGINPDTSWQTLPWHLQGWTANGYLGNPWSQDGFSGSGTNGSPWLQSGFNGTGTTGSPWIQNGFNGTGSQGNPWALNSITNTPFSGNKTTGKLTTGDSWNLPDFLQSDGYKVGKYVVNDVIMGQVGLVGDYLTHQSMQDLGYNSKFGFSSINGFRGNILVNGLKLGVGDHAAFDVYDTANNVATGVKGIQDFQKARQYRNLTSTTGDLASASRNINNLTPPASSVGALSKLNVAAAAVGTGFSVVDTVGSISKFNDIANSNASGSELTEAGAKIGEGVGSTLMNAGVVTTAIPGGQVIGAGMVAAGAVVWVGSKLTGAIASRWKGSVSETAKSMWNGAKDKFNSVKDKVTGWFS